MPFTRAADLSNAVVTKYETDYLRRVAMDKIWERWVDWDAIQEGLGGSSYDFLAFGELDPATVALSETSDIVPVQLRDGNLVVTPAEYGNSVSPTKVARWNARANLRTVSAEKIGNNRALTVDRIIRTAVLGGTNVRYPGTVGARTDLDATNDKVDEDLLIQLWADAIAAGIEPFESGNFVVPCSPLLAGDIARLTTFRNVQYRRVGDGLDALLGGVGQSFTFMGFHFLVHRYGKLYLSGGATAQAATTLSAAVSRGDTTMSLTSDSGIAVGDYVTVGPLEDRIAEQVQIVSGSASPWGILGGGSHTNNLGFRYPHAALVAVTEAANVAALPVIGRNSIKGVYAADLGRQGRVFVKQGLDQADRFVFHGWHHYFGVNVWDALIIRAEAAVTGGVRGIN